MRQDFKSDNIEIWIDNWKRKDVVNIVARSWIDSFPFEKINFIANHSSINIDSFDKDIQEKIKIWPNILRHDEARGPINRNINQAYIHTFLSGKKYCIVAHDSYCASIGWDKCIINTNYEFYSSPQGDGFHLMTLDGLKKYGWWDERYATMGWHEIDYLARVLRKDLISGIVSSSIVDIHQIWPKELNFVNKHSELFYNPVGLEHYIKRFDKNKIIQIGPSKNNIFSSKSNEWHYKKWKYEFSANTTILNLQNGPTQEEIEWYPWLDLQNLQFDSKAY